MMNPCCPRPERMLRVSMCAFDANKNQHMPVSMKNQLQLASAMPHVTE